MKNLLTGMVTLCLMLFISGQIQGQQISGYVYDIEYNKPLSGVNIFIGGTEPGTATNSDGFAGIARGNKGQTIADKAIT